MDTESASSCMLDVVVVSVHPFWSKLNTGIVEGGFWTDCRVILNVEIKLMIKLMDMNTSSVYYTTEFYVCVCTCEKN